MPTPANKPTTHTKQLDTIAAALETEENHTSVVDEQGSPNTSWISIFTDILSFTFFVGVCGLFIWLIFDLQSRASLEFGLSPWTIIGISLFLIAFVGILEGSQIAIINLAEKNQSEFCVNKIHTHKIKTMIEAKEAIHHYLIGRQLLVVVSVIVFSLLTSFPHLRSHEYGVHLPYLLDLIVFKLGLINALVLLWFGQLIPQLIAHRAPQMLLNFWIVKKVFQLCVFFSHLKIAKPSSVVANLVDRENIDQSSGSNNLQD